MCLGCRAGVRHGVYSPYGSICRARNIARPGYMRRYVLDDFHYEGGGLRCEDVPLSEIAASVGTPTYIYSHAALERAYTELDSAFAGLDHLVCFAVKANGNLAVLRALASPGSGRPSRSSCRGSGSASCSSTSSRPRSWITSTACAPVSASGPAWRCAS